MYSRNIVALLTHLTRDSELVIDPDDEIASACIVRDGEIVDERVKAAVEGAA